MQIDINKVKIFVTIPPENLEEVRTAIFEAGAGIIGNYSHCSTATISTGTFKPNEKATPHIGSANNLEFVEEYKLEVICNIENVNKVLKNIRKSHPYEEPAIDIIPLIDESLFN